MAHNIDSARQPHEIAAAIAEQQNRNEHALRTSEPSYLTDPGSEARIRLRLRQSIAHHAAVLRRAGLRKLAQVHPDTLADIAYLRRGHTQSIARDRA